MKFKYEAGLTFLKNELFLSESAIQKRLFFEKSQFLCFLLSDFCTLFLPKTDFLLLDHLFWIADNS